MSRISKIQGYQLMALQMIINTASTLIFKYQSKIEISEGEYFNHPFMQTLTMFIGEAFCYLIFVIYRNRNSTKYNAELQQAQDKGLQTEISLWAVLIPTLCDLFGSCLAFFALQVMPTSVYQMLRGATIIITAIMQVIFLKRIPSNSQIAGMSLVLIGNIIVGITVYLNTTSSEQSGLLIFGIIMLCISFFVFSFQVILEEKYFNNYYLNAFQLVGLEGLWGVLLSAILVSVVNFIPCPPRMADGCPENGDGKSYLEQLDSYFEIAFSASSSYQPQLILSIVGGILSILFLNSIQMTVVKYLSALTRNVIQVTTITLVWASSILIGWEKFYWGQLVGFVILVTGSLIYNDIIKIGRYVMKLQFIYFVQINKKVKPEGDNNQSLERLVVNK